MLGKLIEALRGLEPDAPGMLLDLKPTNRFLDLVSELEHSGVLRLAISVTDDVIDETYPTDRLLRVLELLSKKRFGAVTRFETYGTGKSHTMAFVREALERPERFEARKAKRLEILSKAGFEEKRSRLEKIGIPKADVVLVTEKDVEEDAPLHKIVSKKVLGISSIEDPGDAAELILGRSEYLVVLIDEYQVRVKKDAYLDDDLRFLRKLIESGKALVIISGNVPLSEEKRAELGEFLDKLGEFEKALKRRVTPGGTRFKYSEIIELALAEYDVRLMSVVDSASVEHVASRMAEAPEGEHIVRELVRYLLTSLALYIVSGLRRKIAFSACTVPADVLDGANIPIFKTIGAYYRNLRPLFSDLVEIFVRDKNKRIFAAAFTKGLLVHTVIPKDKLTKRIFDPSIRREVARLPFVSASYDELRLEEYMLLIDESIKKAVIELKLAITSDKVVRESHLIEAAKALSGYVRFEYERDEIKKKIEDIVSRIVGKIGIKNIVVEKDSFERAGPKTLDRVYVKVRYTDRLSNALSRILTRYFDARKSGLGGDELAKAINEAIRSSEESLRNYVEVYLATREKPIRLSELKGTIDRIKSDIFRKLERKIAGAIVEAVKQRRNKVRLEEILVDVEYPKNVVDALLPDINKKIEAIRLPEVESIRYFGGAYEIKYKDPRREMLSFISSLKGRILTSIDKRAEIAPEDLVEKVSSKARELGLDPEEYVPIIKHLIIEKAGGYVSYYKRRDKRVIDEPAKAFEVSGARLVHVDRIDGVLRKEISSLAKRLEIPPGVDEKELRDIVYAELSRIVEAYHLKDDVFERLYGKIKARLERKIAKEPRPAAKKRKRVTLYVEGEKVFEGEVDAEKLDKILKIISSSS